MTSRVCEIDGKPVGMRDEATFGRIRDGYQQKVREECFAG
jgi:hypothetical protein